MVSDGLWCRLLTARLGTSISVPRSIPRDRAGVELADSSRSGDIGLVEPLRGRKYPGERRKELRWAAVHCSVVPQIEPDLSRRCGFVRFVAVRLPRRRPRVVSEHEDGPLVARAPSPCEASSQLSRHAVQQAAFGEPRSSGGCAPKRRRREGGPRMLAHISSATSRARPLTCR